MVQVLIVEDEDALAKPLAFLLEKEGFNPTITSNGNDALKAFSQNNFDIVLLDLMLPGITGGEVFQKLRQQSNIPIIIVTAKDSEIDKIVGLELGADDYVTKPYSARELIARIRAVLRRGQNHQNQNEESPKVISAGPIKIDREKHLVYIDTKEVTLPLKEFLLLECLVNSNNKVVSRLSLINKIWGSDYVGDTKTLDVHIKRLRSKIETDPTNPKFLLTVRGVGYKLSAS